MGRMKFSRSLLTSFQALFGTFFYTRRAEAYAHFISYGYASCLTCHFNAAGNGPLTDYGRALYATAIADKNSSRTDEELSELSGFLGRKRIHESFRPSVDLRSLLLTTQLQDSATRSSRYIPMQSDANLVFTTLEGRLFASGTLGLDSYLDEKGEREVSPISREHYVAYRWENGLSLYGGLMDVLYGLRIPEHVSYSRKNTLIAENDQSHGVMTYFSKESWEAGIHLLTGNLYQNSSTRVMGLSALGEFEVWKYGRVGASIAHFKNDFRTRNQASLHLKTQLLSEGSGLIAELGLIHESNTSPEKYKAPYMFVQPNFRLIRGLHVFAIGEYFHKTNSSHQFKAGPGVQYFPRQRIELRWDLVTSWVHNNQVTSSPSVTSMLQSHFSF
jgi:hypothetical protein